MRAKSSVERVILRSGSDGVSIYLGDCKESLAQLPQTVLDSSSVLTQALCDTNETDDVSFSFPAGVMEAWLEGLGVLQVDFRSPLAKRSSMRLKRPKPRHGLHNCLKAADFLDDQATLTGLCKHICHQLFASFIDSGGREECDEELARELCELPSNLQQLVMATSEAPLLLKLHLLPQPLQDASLHAAFPSITSTASLTTPALYLESAYDTSLWEVVGRQTQLEHLHCTPEKDECLPFSMSTSMVQSIANLKGLLSLNISGYLRPVSQKTAFTLSVSLAFLSSLEDLNISSNSILETHATVLAPAVAKLQCLKRLDMSYNIIQDEGMKILAPVIAQLPVLHSLNLKECKLSKESIVELAKHLKASSSLKQLQFRDCGEVIEIISRLNRSCRLQHLDCSLKSWSKDLPKHLQKIRSLQVLKFGLDRVCVSMKEGISPIDAATLAHSLGTLTGLQELSLSGCNLPDKDLKLIFRHMKGLTSLRSLSVRDNTIARGSGAALAALFPRLIHLTKLDISQEFASWKRCQQGLCQKIHRASLAIIPSLSKLSSLQVLNLSDCYLGSKGVEALHAVVKGLVQLRSLDLSANYLNEDAEHVGSLLSELQSLEHLKLCGNGIHEEEMCFLAEPMGQLSKLKTLSLARNNCEEGGVDALAVQISKLTALVELSLSNLFSFEEGEACAVALAKHLGAMISLQKLDLGRSDVGPTGAAALAPAIGQLTALTYLNLVGNGIRAEGLQSLVPRIAKLKCLQELYMASNDLQQDEGCSILADCVSKLTCLRVLDADDRFETLDSLQRREEELEQCSKEFCPYQTLMVLGLPRAYHW